MHGRDSKPLRGLRRIDSPSGPFEADLPVIGHDHARYDVDEGGFAGTILADNGMNFAGRYGEGYLTQGLGRAIGFRDVANFEKRSRHAALPEGLSAAAMSSTVSA